jgi:N-acetylmuramoyl-L-alanine amidase
MARGHPGTQALTTANTLPFLPKPLEYIQRLDARDPDEIDLIVIHCTELPDLAAARIFGERIVHEGSRTGNCGHYYVDRDGSIEEWVPPERCAHHARGYNERSLGIELVNLGRYPDWYHSAHQLPTEPYPDPQIDALVALLTWLAGRCRSLRWIAGHQHLDTESIAASDDPDVRVRRKIDPGALFPWQRIATPSLTFVNDPSSLCP